MHRTASALLVSLLAASGAAAQDDLVQITGGFDCGPVDEPGMFYQLRGQSVYFSNRTAGLTTGGQLDGIDCRNDPLAQFNISFFEVFPEVNLTDYLTFGYFGIVDTIVATDTDEDGLADTEEIVDTSFVMAVEDNLGEGVKVEDYFPSLDEATLVTALTTTFDSPEFFDALFTAIGHPDLTGDIQIRQVNGSIANVIRPGQQLSLVAFTGGEFGDEGQAIGYIVTDIARIPERLCADQNGDGLVLPNDFSAWIANYNANDLRADVNADGSVNPADFSAWIAAFNLGQFGFKCLN
jgi:hypothetical protein